MNKAAGHDYPTDNEEVRQFLQSISRANDKAQKQAKLLTAEALAAVRATAGNRGPWEKGKTGSAERASWRGRVDIALLSTLRDGLLRPSEAAAPVKGGGAFLLSPQQAWGGKDAPDHSPPSLSGGS